MVFTERDSKYCVDITGTKDGKFITLNSSSRNSSEEGPYLFHFHLICNFYEFIEMLICLLSSTVIVNIARHFSTGLCYRC